MRPSPQSPAVEDLEQRIDDLRRERQDLRTGWGGTAPLERNRLALARAQRELSLALIDRHLHAASTAA